MRHAKQLVCTHPCCLVAHCAMPNVAHCCNRTHTPPPGPSGQVPVNYAPANIWGGAMAAHQAAAAGGSHTSNPNPTPATSSYQSPPPPPTQSCGHQHQQHQQQQQQQPQQQPQQQQSDPSAAVISVSCHTGANLICLVCCALYQLHCQKLQHLRMADKSCSTHATVAGTVKCTVTAVICWRNPDG
jgi:hypothetical protein